MPAATATRFPGTPAARTGSMRFRLPAGVLGPANRLLNQQFWLWGCDIRRAEGNLLAELGFTKAKSPPESGVDISQYRSSLTPHRTLTLWGFGLWLGDDSLGGIFIPRSGFKPRCTRVALETTDAWQPAWFEGVTDPAGSDDIAVYRHLLVDALEWIAWYEERVLEIAGIDYRRQSLDGWHKAECGAGDVAGRWCEIKLGIEALDQERAPSSPAADSHHLSQ